MTGLGKNGAGIVAGLDKCLVVSDFDGTITTRDTNGQIERHFGNEANDAIRDKFFAGEIGIREALPKHFEHIKITEDEYLDFLVSRIKLTPGVAGFQKKLAEAGIPFVILSGGNIKAVESIMNKNNLQVPTVYANEYHFTGRDIEIKCYHQDVSCDQSYGPCGNCKARHMRCFRKDYDHIIFIGDGPTDRCAAKLADYVFARDKLAAFCAREGIAHTVYEDFNDISLYLFGRQVNCQEK